MLELKPDPLLTTNSARVELALILIAWLLFLTMALRVFGPDSDYTNFNSDSAIPILMSNDVRPITVFDTYYYTDDRWGAWPMLLGKLLHQKTGLRWTDFRLHYVRGTWLFFGLLILVCLNTRAAPAVIASGAIAICLEPMLRRRFFDLAQLYAWQLPALFLAWLCLRRMFAQRLRSAGGLQMLPAVAFYFTAFLAISTSIASAPFLLVLITLEAIHSHVTFQNPISKRQIAVALVLLLVATGSELLMKMNYHRYNLKHFGTDFKTPMSFDRGYLAENLSQHWHSSVEFSFFPFIAIAVCFVVGIVGMVLYARFVNKAFIGRVISLFQDETITMVVALTMMALLNFVIMISVSHVRLNNWSDRYLVPTFFFGSVGGMLTIYLAIRALANRFGVTRYVLPVVFVGAFALLYIRFPMRLLSKDYKTDRETAVALSQRAPGTILMGGYWQTYVLTGLQETNTMRPLPLEGLDYRMPWMSKELSDAEQVVIEYQPSEFPSKYPSPPTEWWQYGTRLKLKEAHFYENGRYRFALYVNERRRP